MNTTIVQLTDTHIREPGRLAYGRVDTAEFLERAVASVSRLRQRPDAVVVTGDLVDFGRPAEYARLRALLAPLALPVYLLPGNHDERDALRASFPDHGYLARDDAAPFVQYSVTIGALRLVALDTVVPGGGWGELCDARLQWLDDELARHAGHPVIVAMHHPPFPTLIGHMDKLGLRSGAGRLAQTIARHPNVERVICGHLHRAIDMRFGGTIASTCPGPAHQVSLDLAPDAASAFHMEPPAFRLHVWSPGAGLVTHLAPIGEFDGPYPFFEPGGKLIDR
jgi:3',5'-cyclic AMP phosphodiesterase CpdA